MFLSTPFIQFLGLGLTLKGETGVKASIIAALPIPIPIPIPIPNHSQNFIEKRNPLQKARKRLGKIQEQ
jgi:hypothetical protein